MVSYSFVYSGDLSKKSTMKFAVFCALFAVATCASLGPSSMGGDIERIVQKYGYKINKYEVQTEDGYILNFHRLYQGADGSSNEQTDKSEREVVLLFHGYLFDSEEFVMGGKTEALAFYLIEQGFEVYLANARGTVYGMRHAHLNPKSDSAFWRYCFHDIGAKDLPAVIDKVLEISGRSKLHFIGHMEGSAASYVLLSEKPEYNDKIENLISLGPMAYLQNSKHELINKAINYDRVTFNKNFGMSTFNPSELVMKDVRDRCVSEKYERKVCDNAYFLMNGYNSVNYNETTVDEILPRVPIQAASKALLHWVQIKKSGRFEKFDENFSGKTQGLRQVEEYDLSKITVPVAFLYAPNDYLSSVDDINTLKGKFTKVYGDYMFEEFSNNMDLILAKDVERVNQKVVEFLKVNSV